MVSDVDDILSPECELIQKIVSNYDRPALKIALADLLKKAKPGTKIEIIYRNRQTISGEVVCRFGCMINLEEELPSSLIIKDEDKKIRIPYSNIDGCRILED